MACWISILQIKYIWDILKEQKIKLVVFIRKYVIPNVLLKSILKSSSPVRLPFQLIYFCRYIFENISPYNNCSQELEGKLKVNHVAWNSYAPSSQHFHSKRFVPFSVGHPQHDCASVLNLFGPSSLTSTIGIAIRNFK